MLTWPLEEFQFAALPPDVRKVYDLPGSSNKRPWGYAPKVGAKPQGEIKFARKVRDLPHIERQSRETSCRVFGWE